MALTGIMYDMAVTCISCKVVCFRCNLITNEVCSKLKKKIFAYETNNLFVLIKKGLSVGKCQVPW